MSVYQSDDYRHLLSAVRAAPDDDLPRLVLADWLEERGEAERAELIRVQCQPGYVPDWADWQPRTKKDNGFLVTREQELHRNLLPGLRLLGWGSGFVCYSPESTWSIVTRIDVRFVRGFLHAVRGPLSALVGSECGTCSGRGHGRHASLGGALPECPQCRGTGRTPGILPGLVRREPVERVEVTDREPYHAAIGYSWVRWDTSRQPVLRDDDVLELAAIPQPIWGHIQGHTNSAGQVLKWFPTADAAKAALSAATLVWAESE